MIGKLLTWLIRRVFGLRHQYFELEDGRYLKVKRGAATIVDTDDVPDHFRVDRGDVDGPLLTLLEDAKLASAQAASDRHSALETLNPLTVLKKATKNSVIEQDILENPDLVDADNTFEAQLKLDLVDGQDVSETIDATDEVAEDDVEEMLDTEFIAKWGYNKYGDDLPRKINEGDTSPESSNSDAHSGATSETTIDEHESEEASSSSGNSASTGNSASSSSAMADGNTAEDGNSA